MWIDSHCHLAWEKFREDLPQVLARAKEAGVAGMIVIGAGEGVEGNPKAIDLAAQHPNLWAAVGIHPHDAAQTGDLKNLASQSKVVAIGETGLDYHYDHSPRKAQQERFAEQIALAGELNLPLVIHSREAWQDTLAVLKEGGPPERGGVFHCFSGGWKEAKQALDLGFYISVSGIVTFKKAESLVEVVHKIPLERILIETDAPYLAPVPHRGERNEPAFVKFVGEKIAEIRSGPVEKVSGIILNNTKTLFHL
ncbi:MAG: TatD family hydrolase [Deltaproteobacteria bacterium]|nr:TatD family hydrolase [Deltaproteobacteria bacterium]MBI4223479.1 TatD family hydrolase [Deltaproteobacteria bacterium]